MIFDAVVDQLLRIDSDSAGVIVTIDDIQWIDEASAALIHYASRALAGSNVRLACAARPGELGDNPAALRLVRALQHQGTLRQVELSPLNATQTAALVCRSYPDIDAGRVFEESGGNPLFALEVARALDRGEGPTSSLNAILHDRLDRLEVVPRTLLGWAATFGREFLLDELLRVAGFPAGAFMTAIDELERRGFIRPMNATGNGARYDFAHDLLRHAAYHAVSEPRRCLMHLAIARSLQGSAEAEGALAGDIAHHAALGCDNALAARYCLTAAERCLQLCAAREALELAERGLCHTPGLDSSERARLEVGLLRVAIFADVGRNKARSLELSIRKAIPAAEAAGHHAEASRGMMALSFLHFDSGNFNEAELESIKMSEAARLVSPQQSIHALAHAAQCLALLERDITKAEALVVEAKAMADEHQVEVLELLLAQGFILQYRGNSALARGPLNKAFTLAEQQGVHWLGAVCLLRLATGELLLGCPERALEFCDKLRDITSRLGEASEGPLGRVIEAVARRQLGQEGPPGFIDEALKTLDAMDAKAYLGEAYCLLAESELRRGDALSARCHAELALAAANQIVRPNYVAWAQALLVRATITSGDVDRARIQLQSALSLLDSELQLSAHAREQIAEAAHACDPVRAN